MVAKPTVIILGKLPPPYMGPSLATQIILNSSLKNDFHLIHLDTRTYQSLNDMGKWSIHKIFLNAFIYIKLFFICIFKRPVLVLIPVSQTTLGFIKDSIFIWAAKITGKKILLQLRGSDFKRWFDGTKGIVKKYISSSVKTADGVVVLGNNLRFIFLDFFPDDKIFVSPNGADYVFPVVKKNTSQIKILYLANLQSSKGIEDLIEAIQILKKRNINNFHLDVVGLWRSEETRKKCMSLVENYYLPVSFFSPVSGEEKMIHFAYADIFAFTPRAPEGHPWVIVEAMAAGLPIISTDSGAIIESVNEGVNGFIVGIKKPNEIANKLELLIKDDRKRIKMGNESRRLYEENFTESKMVMRLKNIFNLVAGKAA